MKTTQCHKCEGSGLFGKGSRCYTCSGTGVLTAAKAQEKIDYWNRFCANGECSEEVRDREIAALEEVIDDEVESSINTTMLDSVLREMDAFTEVKHRRNGDRIDDWSQRLRKFRNTLRRGD